MDTRLISYRIVVEQGDDGGFVVTFPDVPEAITQGVDKIDALAQAAGALEVVLRIYAERGLRLPQPKHDEGYLITISRETTDYIWRLLLLTDDTRDIYGREYARVSEVHVGSSLVVNNGNSCLRRGAVREVMDDLNPRLGLYIRCALDRHYLKRSVSRAETHYTNYFLVSK